MTQTARLGCTLAFGITLSVLGWGCSGSNQIGHGKALSLGQRPNSPATGLVATTVGTHALAYHVAFAPPYLLSIELRTQFELVLRDDGADRDPSISEERIVLGPPDYDIRAMVLAPPFRQVFIASDAGWVRSYDVGTLSLLSEWRMGSSVRALAIDDTHLYIGTQSGVICLRRLRDGAQLQCMVAHQSPISALAVHENLLISSSEEGELSHWDPISLRHIGSRKQPDNIADIAISGSGKFLAVARNSVMPKVGSAETKAYPFTSPGNHTIEVWSLESGGLSTLPTKILAGHRSQVSSVTWLGQDILSTGWDRMLKLWSTTFPNQAIVLKRFHHIVRDVAVSPTRGYFAAAGWALSEDAPAVLVGPLLY